MAHGRFFITKYEYLQDCPRKGHHLPNSSLDHQDPNRSSTPAEAKDIYSTGLDRRRTKQATLHVWVGDQGIQACHNGDLYTNQSI